MNASVSSAHLQPMAAAYPLGYCPEFALAVEPRFFDGEEFDRLLEHCAGHDASDVTIQTEEPVWAHIQGRNNRLTKRNLTANEVEAITNAIYGSNGVTQIRKGEEIDARHTVVRRAANSMGSMVVVSKLGFRVNITGCWSHGDENGIQITVRPIKALPPSLDEMGIEPEIVDALYPEQGLGCICGPTGSGKSTLLAGALRKKIEDPNSHTKIITYEAPIEYVYDELERASAIVSQHEVPRHVASFARGVRNALRRAPKIILVGETRDMETAQASLEASQTGHMVYTTVHTNSVPNTLSRLANMFPPAERMTKVFELAESLRFIIVQRLVRRADAPGRVALREYLVFDQSVRDHLRSASSLREAEHMLAKLVERQGQTMLSSAQRAFDAGLISADTMMIFERESKSDFIADLNMHLN
jgi:defect-in-organelle-trafficking protein DotB